MRLKIRYFESLFQDDKGIGMSYPEGVACSEKYGLIVGDTGNDRLVRYAFENGALKAGKEIKIPQLLKPFRVQVTSKGDILALDGKQRRIVRLGADGAFKEYVTAEGALGSATMVPRSVKIDRADNIYILDILPARVLVLNPDGKFQKEIPFPKDYHRKKVTERLEAHQEQIVVFYLPSYCPELNPDEYLNGDLKNRVHSGT